MVFDHYYDLAFGMSVFEITDCFSDLAERVTSLYDGNDLPGRKKIAQESQIRPGYPGDEKSHLPAPDP